MDTPLAAARPSILFESPTILAVDKPTGIIVHGDGTGVETLTDAVRAMLVTRGDVSASEALQAIQRLDRDTSGIVLFSLDKATQPAYDRMIAEHNMTKRYLAVVEGRVPWRQHTFREPIGRDRHDARRMRVSKTGKQAVTHVELLDVTTVRRRTYSLLSVRIETGRKHQIRVHLSHAGFPIVGDVLYGRAHPQDLMLHALELAFTDPVTHSSVHVLSPVPTRFQTMFPQR